MGIVDKIKKASKLSEIESLIAEGNKFDMVSPKTKRRWVHVARQRQVEWAKLAEAKAQAEKKKAEKPATTTEDKKKPYQKPKKS